MLDDNKTLEKAKMLFNKQGRKSPEDQAFLHEVVVELKDVTGKSLDDIGRIMNKSKGTIYNYYHFENQGETREVEVLKKEIKEKDNQIKNLTEQLNQSKDTIDRFCTDTEYERLKKLKDRYEQASNELTSREKELEELYQRKLNELSSRGKKLSEWHQQEINKIYGKEREIDNRIVELQKERYAVAESMKPQYIEKRLKMPDVVTKANSIINENKDMFFNKLFYTTEGQLMIRDWLNNNVKDPLTLELMLNEINSKLVCKAMFDNMPKS